MLLATRAMDYFESTSRNVVYVKLVIIIHHLHLEFEGVVL